jgi:DNA-binding LacI/PurR family transcriptional regulator
MPRPAKKTPEVLDMILKRIRKGVYGGGQVPSTRKLADELGVSKFTILRAYRMAEQRGLLQRVGRKRLVTVAPGRPRDRSIRLACVVPAVDLVSSFHWFLSIDSVAAEKGGVATLVDYRSASDPRLTQALGNDYDVIFLDPPASPLSSLLTRLLAKKRNAVVPLYADMPEVGLLGIDNMPAEAVDLLVFHMASLGHTKIHLVGGQPLIGRQQAILRCWQECLGGVKAVGDHFAPTGEGGDMLGAAEDATRRLLAVHPQPAAIIFCDLLSAMGGYRALWEAGMHPGKDLHVAALTCEPEARYLTPSLTCLTVPSRESVIAEAVEAVLTGRGGKRKGWTRNVLPKIRLHVGESSGWQEPKT